MASGEITPDPEIINGPPPPWLQDQTLTFDRLVKKTKVQLLALFPTTKLLQKHHMAYALWTKDVATAKRVGKPKQDIFKNHSGTRPGREGKNAKYSDFDDEDDAVAVAEAAKEAAKQRGPPPQSKEERIQGASTTEGRGGIGRGR